MLRSRQNLDIGEWATITVSRNTETQESRLSVDKETPIRSIENGNMHVLELKTHLYVGGYDAHKVKIAKQVDVETNFKGCIKMVWNFIFFSGVSRGFSRVELFSDSRKKKKDFENFRNDHTWHLPKYPIRTLRIRHCFVYVITSETAQRTCVPNRVKLFLRRFTSVTAQSIRNGLGHDKFGRRFRQRRRLRERSWRRLFL